MKKNHLFCYAIFTFFLLAFVSSLNAQAPAWLWAKSAGGTNSDWPYSVAVDALGDVYMAGSFNSPTVTFGSITLTNTGSTDLFLAKYDANGNVLWAKSAGGADVDWMESMVVDASGNTYITGYYKSPTLTFGSTTLSNTGYYDMFIVKYDVNGSVLWAKSAIDGGDDRAVSNAVDAIGNTYVLGYFQGHTLTFGSTTLTNSDSTCVGRDLFLAKYDVNGNVLWAKSAGGSESEEMTSIAVDALGNSSIAGISGSSTLTLDSITLTNPLAFIAKYDTDGNVLWAKGEGEMLGLGKSVAVDALGNTYMAGFFGTSTVTFGSTTLTNTNIGYCDMFIVKYDVNGNVLWAKSAGGTYEDMARCVTVDASGNTYITGDYKSSILTFGSTTLTNMSIGYYDMFIVKYDVNGNVLWAKSAGSTNSDVGFSVALNNVGSIYVAGSFGYPPIYFDSITLTSAGLSDIFIAKLSTSTGISEVNGEITVKVFPNPVTDNLTIETPQKAIIEISNIQGQQIERFSATGNKTGIDISSFPSGVYFVKVKTEEGIVLKKFVKE
jgi:hypothetical protein